MHKPMFKSSNTQGFVRGRTSKLRFDRYIRRKLKPGEQLKFFCLHKRLGAGLDHEVRQYCTRTSKTRKKLKSSLCSVFFIFWLFSVLFCVLFCVLFLDLVTFRLFSLLCQIFFFSVVSLAIIFLNSFDIFCFEFTFSFKSDMVFFFCLFVLCFPFFELLPN